MVSLLLVNLAIHIECTNESSGIERDSTDYLWELNYQLTQEFEH
jgi:hypothetical protein